MKHKLFFTGALAVGFFMPLASNAQDISQCQTVFECAQNAMQAAQEAKMALQLAVPRGAVMTFNLGECPVGWTQLKNAEGRYIVGLTAGKKPGSLVGTQLSPEENRPTGKHSHGHKAPRHYNSGAGGHARAKPDARGTTDPSGKVEGTNAPYIELLICERR